NGGEGSTISFTVTAADPVGDPITGFTADLSALPAGHGASFVTNASKTQGTFSWTPGYTASRVAPYAVSFIATSGASGTGSGIVPMVVTNVDRAPVVTVPANLSVLETDPLAVVVTAADPDGDAIASLVADLTGLPGGNAGFVANPSRTGGTLTWTPTYA